MGFFYVRLTDRYFLPVRSKMLSSRYYKSTRLYVKVLYSQQLTKLHQFTASDLISSRLSEMDENKMDIKVIGDSNIMYLNKWK